LAQANEAFEPNQSFVRVNRLKDGIRTWNVSVAADDNSDDALQQAKEQAVRIVRELEDEFRTTTTAKEVPF
jgi:hypothetical protein